MATSATRTTATVLLASACFAVALLAVVFLLVSSAKQSQSVDRRVCTQVELLKGYVRQALYRSRKTIPTLDYYRRHPAERARALELIGRDLDLFKPRRCV